MLEICRNLGITYLVTLYSHSRGSKPERLSGTNIGLHILGLKRRLRQFVALRGYLERFTEAAAQNGIGPCYAGRNLCNIDSQGEVGLCIDRLHESVGNILTDDVFDLQRRLLDRHRTNRNCDCGTSCRGSIEAALHGRGRLLNLLDYHQMTRAVPLKGAF